MTLSKSNGRLATVLLGCATIVVALLGASCSSEPHPFKQPITFAGNSEYPDGITVDARTLNDGYEAYMQYCYACHGEKGDGKGPASYGLRPAPRDFTKAVYKFGRMREGDDIPHDTDLYRIIRGGLHGTAMLPWDIPQVELEKIVHYIKTFSVDPKEPERVGGRFTRMKKKRGGEAGEMELVKTLEPFEVPADPWAGKEEQARQLGKELYHLRAECLNCHPSYGTKQEIYELSVAANKRDPGVFSVIKGFREDPNGSVAKDAEVYQSRLMPPDFLFHPVRSATSPDDVTGDLYRIIAYGVYPIMPAWTGALKDEEIWAIAHYVRSLMDLKDTPEATKLKERFATQPAFEIPAAPAEQPAQPTPTEEAPKEGEGDKKGEEKKDDAKDKAPDKAPDKKAPEKAPTKKAETKKAG